MATSSPPTSTTTISSAGGSPTTTRLSDAFSPCTPSSTCDAYDPHSEGGVTHPRLRFHRAILGYRGLGAARNALVKIDIEGYEWPWLAGLTASRHIAQFVIELHSPHLRRRYWKALARLAETHYLIHAHGNNCDGLVDVDGVRIPGTIECTWVRKDLDPDLPKSRAPIRPLWTCRTDLTCPIMRSTGPLREPGGGMKPGLWETHAGPIAPKTSALTTSTSSSRPVRLGWIVEHIRSRGAQGWLHNFEEDGAFGCRVAVIDGVMVSPTSSTRLVPSTSPSWSECNLDEVNVWLDFLAARATRLVTAHRRVMRR